MNKPNKRYKIPEGEEYKDGRKPKQDFERRYKYNKQQWERIRTDDRRRSWTPWLVIRYSLTDLGFRPTPSGAIVYQSPDIWIESSDALGNAVAGENNFVHARIFNLGKADAAPTKVDFYWADPSLGLGADQMNLIGTEWVEVEAHTVKDVRCNTPWVPVFLNNGHECLKVNCNSPILDPITSPFNPGADRHVGQRNITVLEGSAGNMINFSLFVNNLFPLQANVSIRTRIEHLFVEKNALKKFKWNHILNHLAGFGDLNLTKSDALQTLYNKNTEEFQQANRMYERIKSNKNDEPPIVFDVAEMKTMSRTGACVNASFEEHSCLVKPRKQYSGFATTLLSSDKLAKPIYDGNSNKEIQLLSGTMQPFEQRKLELQLGVPTNAKPGEFIVCHLLLITQEFLTGGYTIIIKVV